MNPRFAALLLVAVSCTGGDSPSAEDGATHLTLAPDLSIGELSGDDALVFGRIGGVARDGEGRIYVADRQASEVRVFDAGGAHRFTIGRQGAGPGEFDGPCCIAFDARGRLWVRDGGNTRFAVFAVEADSARLLHTIRMATSSGNFWAATHFTDHGRLVQVGHRPGPRATPDQVLLHTDTAGQVSDSVRIAAVPDDSIGVRTVPFGDGGMFFVYQPHGPLELIAHGPGGQYAKAISSAYRVAWYDGAGALLRVIEKPGEVGPELTAEERAEAEERVSRDAERFNLSATQRASVPDRKPPLESLFFDESARLWVQRSTRPDESNRADVYGADGSLAFTAEWPADITLRIPALVGTDTALGIAVDSLGVQRVVRLPLR